MGRPKGSLNKSSGRQDSEIDNTEELDGKSPEIPVEAKADPVVEPIVASVVEPAKEAVDQDIEDEEPVDADSPAPIAEVEVKPPVELPEKVQLLNIAPEIFKLLNTPSSIKFENETLRYDDIPASMDPLRFQKAMNGWGLVHEDWPWCEPDAIRNLAVHPDKKQIWNYSPNVNKPKSVTQEYVKAYDSPFMIRPAWQTTCSPVSGDKPKSWNLKMRVAQFGHDEATAWNKVIRTISFQRDISSPMFIKLGIKYDSSLFDHKRYKIAPSPLLVYGNRISKTDRFNMFFSILNNEIYDMDGEAAIAVCVMGADSTSTKDRFTLKSGMEVAYVQFFD